VPTFFLGAFFLAGAFFFFCGAALDSYALSSEASDRLGAVVISDGRRRGASAASAPRSAGGQPGHRPTAPTVGLPLRGWGARHICWAVLIIGFGEAASRGRNGSADRGSTPAEAGRRHTIAGLVASSVLVVWLAVGGGGGGGGGAQACRASHAAVLSEDVAGERWSRSRGIQKGRNALRPASCAAWAARHAYG